MTDVTCAGDHAGASGRPRDPRALSRLASRVTETALTTALNTSYMAEQISLFGIAVGGAFLLVGLAFGAAALRGVRIARPSLANRDMTAKALKRIDLGGRVA